MADLLYFIGFRCAGCALAATMITGSGQRKFNQPIILKGGLKTESVAIKCDCLLPVVAV